MDVGDNEMFRNQVKYIESQLGKEEQPPDPDCEEDKIVWEDDEAKELRESSEELELFLLQDFSTAEKTVPGMSSAKPARKKIVALSCSLKTSVANSDSKDDKYRRQSTLNCDKSSLK
eukprot:TRINITY_DN5199_c0_g1_i1.p2 TRINITY_DN5199_c0_g1~~TRINITY_DN5199_c0_g1_i1.p2  ORF type:complete len:117 (-),score=38.44 TRINITY_DN5199_c0_g1_i1:4-354(-)